MLSVLAVVTAGGILFTATPAFAQSTNRQSLQTKLKQRLDKAVSDGKLTGAQEQLILDKVKELEAKRQQDLQNWKNLTPEQRKSAMQEQKTDLENWAKQNNIDLKYLRPELGMGRKFGHH